MAMTTSEYKLTNCKVTIYAVKEKNIFNTNPNSPTDTPAGKIKLRKSIDEEDTFTDYDCSLISLRYHKEVYKPGEIDLRLQIGSTTVSPKILFKTFNGAYINIENTYTNDTEKALTHVVAQKYYVFDVLPEFQAVGTGTSFYVDIKAYSPDKYLTLMEYSKAYTGRKLYSYIVIKELKAILSAVFGKDLTNNDITKENFRQLKYTKDDAKHEAIFPYLVQYNESFYDFLVRTMNRCGEFLYYENDGAVTGSSTSYLYLGLKDVDEDPIEIGNYTSYTFNNSLFKTAAYDTFCTPFYRDYTKKDASADSLRHRNSELAADAYLALLPEKDKYSSWEDFMGWPNRFWVTTAPDILALRSLGEMLTYAAKTILLQPANKVKSDKVNKIYKKNNFSEDDETFSERKNGDQIHPYSTTYPEAEKLTLAFYEEIRSKEEIAKNAEIQINLGTEFYPLLLGSLIKFDTEQYIVVEIEGDIMFSIAGTVTSDTKIVAIPYDADNLYPPTADVSKIRTSKAQTALITSNSDPLKMHRVRVRYPWQSADDDESPWIRMVVPMASDGTGFKFLPNIGDEALIDYENGNVEKPYVAGMLYSESRHPYADVSVLNQRSITSANGHTIRFTDNEGSNFYAGLLSGLSLVRSYMPKVDWAGDDNENLRKLSGGIELTDTFGMYSIKASSDTRKISISSPWGDVSINAFTGITLNAPNGNIKIAGKNVDIVAGNNLSLTSGANIVKEGGWKKRLLVNPGLEFETWVVASLLDLTLLRVTIEALLKPIGGTMLIKSHRYLRMEAGKGKTAVLDAEWKTSLGLGKATKLSLTSSLLNLFKPKYTETELPTHYWDANPVVCVKKTIGFIRELFDTYKKAWLRVQATAYVYNSFQNCLANKQVRILPVNDFINRAKDNKSLENINEDGEVEIPAVDKAGYDQARSALFTEVKNADPNLIWKNSSNGIKAIYLDCWSEFEGTYKSRIINLCKDVNIFAQNRDYLAAPPDVNNVNMDNELLRAILTNLVVWIGGKDTAFKITSEIDITDDIDITEGNWNEWVNSIEVKEPDPVSSSPLAIAAATALKGLRTYDFVDQNVWHMADHGQILLSSAKDQTVYLNGKQFDPYTQSMTKSEDLGELKRLLRAISPVSNSAPADN